MCYGNSVRDRFLKVQCIVYIFSKKELPSYEEVAVLIEYKAPVGFTLEAEPFWVMSSVDVLY